MIQGKKYIEEKEGAFKALYTSRTLSTVSRECGLFISFNIISGI